MHTLAPTAKRRRKHHKKATAAKRRTHRRKKGLAEGLSAGVLSGIQPVVMGVMGAVAGLLVNSFFPTTTPIMKIGIGAGGAMVLVKFAKAPNFAAGFASGMAMPAIAQLLQPQTMSDGYLNEDLPEIIDDGESLSSGYMGASAYLSADEFEGLDA